MMRSALLGVVLAAVVVGAHPLGDAVGAAGNAAKTWAVLVAGSRGWSNYRHQADVCHAFQALRELGVPEEQIIVFMYDDLANSASNPFKGQIFNEPGCKKDVYGGVPHDYVGNDVTVANFLAVMTGKDMGPGRKTLRSGPSDNVFLYYDDHGNVGLLAFPVGPNLVEAQFHEMVATMTAKKMYSQLVLYVQACESASMLYRLPFPSKVYGVSSAPIDASAYAFNYDDKLRTYVASRWAYAWIIAAETQPPTATLQDQFDSTWDYVKNWSQPCQFGDLTLTKHNVRRFFNPAASRAPIGPLHPEARFIDQGDAVPQWDVPLVLAERRYAETNSLEALSELREEQRYRLRVDTIVNRIIDAGVPNAPHLTTVPCDKCDRSCQCYSNCIGSLPAKGCEFVCCNERSCFERAPRTKQAVALDCAAKLYSAFAATCGADKRDYASSASWRLNRLCRHEGVNVDAALHAIHEQCSA